jgi:uncharacterized protein YceK
MKQRAFYLVTTALLAVVVLTSGCSTVASQKYVAFSMRGQPPDLQQRDIMECEGIAQMYKGSDADAAVAMGGMGLAVGAASGAAYGAILGAVSHGISAGSGSLIGLGVGAAMGLTIGIIQGVQANNLRYQRLYIGCLRARGYEVAG